MKSIYSRAALQRIIDHWGIGVLEDVQHFENPGSDMWRHRIETSHGDFELFSYPVSTREYAEKKLNAYLIDHFQVDPVRFQNKLKVHSFDREHVLLQFAQKEQISLAQAKTELDNLVGASIEEAFRVYGSIFQMHLNDANVRKATILVSYGWWSILDSTPENATVIVDTEVHTKEQMDAAIEQMVADTPTILKYALHDKRFELFLSNNRIIQFEKDGKFAAIELHLHGKRNNVHIFEEGEIYYTRDLRDEE